MCQLYEPWILFARHFIGWWKSSATSKYTSINGSFDLYAIMAELFLLQCEMSFSVLVLRIIVLSFALHQVHTNVVTSKLHLVNDIHNFESEKMRRFTRFCSKWRTIILDTNQNTFYSAVRAAFIFDMLRIQWRCSIISSSW